LDFRSPPDNPPTESPGSKLERPRPTRTGGVWTSFSPQNPRPGRQYHHKKRSGWGLTRSCSRPKNISKGPAGNRFTLLFRLHSQLRILPNITTSPSSSAPSLTQPTVVVEDPLSSWGRNDFLTKQQPPVFSRHLYYMCTRQCIVYRMPDSVDNIREDKEGSERRSSRTRAM